MARKVRLAKGAEVSAASETQPLSDDASDRNAQQLGARMADFFNSDDFMDQVAEKVAERVSLKLADKIATTIAAKVDQTLSHLVDQHCAKRAADAVTQDSAIAAHPPSRDTTALVSDHAQPATRTRAVNKAESRRKRKRNTQDDDYATEHSIDLPKDALLEALKPLDARDVEEWNGWVEVESEPAFFNSILQRLGVRQVATKELLSLEHWALATLPQPVLGLIFLFQYAPHLDDQYDDAEDEKDALIWFANQTTNNSCASVALLNIVMNSHQVPLGPELQAFKASTQHLSSPLRGHKIGSNNFIRKAHNSFARRMDQLNADLYLANEVEESRRAQAKRRSRPKRATRREPAVPGEESSKESRKGLTDKLREPEVDYAYHFIAYVPAGGSVWELDGMRTKPRKIGPLQSSDWTSVAGPRIQERVREYGDEENNFSLLALYRSPLLALRDSIASSLAAMRLVHAHMQADESFTNLVAAEERVLDLDSPTQLHEFGLDLGQVDAAEVPAPIRAQLADPTYDAQLAFRLHQSLADAARAAIAKYREEWAAGAVQEDRVRDRQKDYMPALNCWLAKLAEKGVLEDIIKMPPSSSKGNHP